MNYQTVLQNYLPVEQGDFMLKYEIDDRGYAIYSPEKGSFSCIELHGFSELTPWQLAFLLSLDMQQMKEQDEFSLSVCCKREKLLSYLFDVEESETTLKTKHVSGWQGYLMMDIHKPDRVRNVFQFHPETKKARLVFDNRLCVASFLFLTKGKRKRKERSSISVGVLLSLLPSIGEESVPHRLICWLLMLPCCMGMP